MKRILLTAMAVLLLFFLLLVSQRQVLPQLSSQLLLFLQKLLHRLSSLSQP